MWNIFLAKPMVKLYNYSKYNNFIMNGVPMNENERQIIINKAKNFFREKIAKSHLKNTETLKDLDVFNVNPFITN